MRFYLDEDLSDAIVEVARERFELDVTCSHAVGMDRATDEEQLAYAIRQRRCIVTRNGRDFERLTRSCVQSQADHPGVLVVPPSMTGREFGAIAQGLAFYHRLYSDDVVPYLFAYLPAHGVGS